jgi:hypothetical protein
MHPIDEAEVHSAAEDRTGLSDWGDGDSYREGLSVLLADTSRLPTAVQELAFTMIVGQLAQRLQLVSDAKAEPEILSGVIEAPVIVIGLPRTGTTLLHELLTFDPVSRAPLMWEAEEPSPPPDLATYATDPRIEACEERHRESANSDVGKMHPVSATLPTECHQFTMSHFDSAYFIAFMDVPGYREWYVADRRHSLYSTHRRVLQQLQWRGPRGRWTLKSPPHLLSLDALLAAYPDACLVQTHRDPREFIASLSSMITATRRQRGPDVASLR